MSAAAIRSTTATADQPELALGRQIIRAEAQTLLALADNLSPEFCRAVDLFLACRGSVIVSGMGKAGLVAQKIVATLASTGARAHFLHPAEAVHGDLGRIAREDVALLLSSSGETEEIVRILPHLKEIGVLLVAITGQPRSTLGRGANVTLDLGSIREACPLGLAPSASTTAMMALGDALALTLSQARQFSAADFARFHPAGSLGRKLAKVEDVMRPLAECRVAREDELLRAALVTQSRPGRRTGAIMVVDARGRLAGIFTDSDLARLLEKKQDAALDQPIRAVMTAAPRRAPAGASLAAACELLAQWKISELPVVDAEDLPLGLLDITDIVGVPAASREKPSPPDLKIVPFPVRRMKDEG